MTADEAEVLAEQLDRSLLAAMTELLEKHDPHSVAAALAAALTFACIDRRVNAGIDDHNAVHLTVTHADDAESAWDRFVADAHEQFAALQQETAMRPSLPEGPLPICPHCQVPCTIAGVLGPYCPVCYHSASEEDELPDGDLADYCDRCGEPWDSRDADGHPRCQRCLVETLRPYADPKHTDADILRIATTPPPIEPAA